MNEYKPDDDELRRYRDEAAELLSIEAETPQGEMEEAIVEIRKSEADG